MAWLLASLVGTFRFEAVADDAGVRIVSPVAGQQFAPGARVSILVEMAPWLAATDGSIGLVGLGFLKAEGFTGTRFTADFVIPNEYAGPLLMRPFAWAGEMVSGPEVSIAVRPETRPRELHALQRYYYLSLPQANPTQIRVRGRYSNGVERDLSSSVSGTSYISSNPSVVSVDREGVCTVVANGLAVITIENRGVRDFVAFVVTDPVNPGPAIDLSHQVEIRRGKLRPEPNPRVVRSHYQQVTITNTSELPLAAPLFLKLSSLPNGLITYGGHGDGVHRLSLPDQGLGLLPGQSVTVELEFLNQGTAPIDYTTTVYHGEP
jgi:hypothetical protein